jgi:menaquinone-dependent protoporphyrinogen IX oxidase
MKVLITYYHFGETPKVAQRLGQTFLSKGITAETFLIEDKKKTPLKKQFKNESKLEVAFNKNLEDYDLIIVGSPVVSFSSAPIINQFLKSLPELMGKKFILYATGIGLPGNTVKKMTGILSTKAADVIDSEIFSSIFPFDEKKLKEVDAFIERFKNKLKLEV